MTIKGRSRVLATAGAVVITVFAGRAEADPQPAVPATTEVDEESLIARGIELREKRDDEAALGLFRKAYERSKSARCLAQIALAEQALGRWVDAETHLSEAIVRADDPWIARKKPVLAQSLTEIQGHLGSLELSGGIAGAEVVLNGQPAGTFPVNAPLRVPSGSVAMEVRAPGYLPMVRTVTVPGGGLARESVVLIAIREASSAPAQDAGPSVVTTAKVTAESPGAPATVESWGTRKKVALGLGAGAIVAGVVGAVFLVKADGYRKDFNRTEANGGRCTLADPVQPAPCQSILDDKNFAVKAGVAGLVGAVLMGGAGAYLYFTGNRSEGPRIAARALRFDCAPHAGLGVACAGAF